jgi:hypothetical protein
VIDTGDVGRDGTSAIASHRPSNRSWCVDVETLRSLVIIVTDVDGERVVRGEKLS